MTTRSFEQSSGGHSGDGGVADIHNEAQRMYKAGDFHSSIRRYTQAIEAHSNLDPSAAPCRRLLPQLLSNRAAGLFMIGAVKGTIHDCETALASPQFNLNDLFLQAELYTLMARAWLKAGDAKKALESLALANKTATNVMDSAEEQLSEANILSRIKQYETEVFKFQELLGKVEGFKLPTLHQPGRGSKSKRNNSVEVNSEVNSAISMCLLIAPCCIDLHEKKVAILASLGLWHEVGSHCERLAAMNVQYDNLSQEDLDAIKPFPYVPPAEALKSTFFGDPTKEDFKIQDFEAAELTLSAEATAEAVLRLPLSLCATYLCALRLEERYGAADAAITALCVAYLPALGLEERYPTAEAAINSLQQYVDSKIGKKEYDHVVTAFIWLRGESTKLASTRQSKKHGKELYDKFEFERAAKQYAACLKVNSEGVDSIDSAGGSLRAVLHCNLAACHMARKHFKEAIQECSAALHIYTNYMKPIRRKGRCYFLLQRYEEAISEYNTWFEFVKEAEKSPQSCAAFVTPCLFGGPQKVTKKEIDRVKQELQEAQEFKKQKEIAEASYRHERQKVHEPYSSCHRRRRKYWHNQQGASDSRRWDSYNFNSRHSHRYSESRRGSQNSGLRVENSFNTAGTHYAVLEVAQDASEDDLKKAFRKMALKWHPDKNKDPSAPDIFRKVKLAYEILNDPNEREKYDRKVK